MGGRQVRELLPDWSLPKPGFLQTAQDPAYSAVSPLFNKGSLDPAGEKASFPSEFVGFCPGGLSALVSREMLIEAARAGCGQVSFPLCQFPEYKVIHQNSEEIFAQKPLARVLPQTIPHHLGPVPKRFPVHGDPSAPGSRLQRRLEPCSGEDLFLQSE